MEKYLKYYRRVIGAGVIAATAGLSSAMAADKLKVTLNWTPDTPSLGIVYADALGYYKDAGIDLVIEPGKGSGTTSQLVAAGSTDVGLANGPSAIAIAAKGAPVKIITPIFQAAEWGVISLDDTPISRPKDLEGKSIAMAAGSADVALFQMMLDANGVDKSKIRILSADASGNIGLLAEKKVDGVSAAPGDVMVPLAEKGIRTKIMYYRDNGAPLVGISLIARDDKLKQNPDLYKRFVDATLKGYSAAAKDPGAAVDALRSRYSDAPAKSALMEDFTKYYMADFCVAGATGLGKPPASLWAATGKALTTTLGSLGDGGIEAKHTEDYLPAQVPPCP
ncbi:MAG: ABC transporter substrate-binding protein [Mesorhizobium sp.]|uniref:ABC transporter substrate-binding protein n=1 Tax=Mesorhizobium sp. TaxID=1871066 RepID=UPI0011FF94D3|nr:ABC transporter substrate-binding protein [Mesorhizobium sp.]TIR03452.1 MAG: ABC transporter substrate-binding protein [Mesorhizobium sp.]